MLVLRPTIRLLIVDVVVFVFVVVFDVVVVLFMLENIRIQEVI